MVASQRAEPSREVRPGTRSFRLSCLTTTLRGLARLAPGNIEAEVRGLRHWVKPGGTCIDVGAEYGLYTMTLADLVGPRGQVLACEPQTSLATWVGRLTRAMGAHNVTIEHLALGDQPANSSISIPSIGFWPVHGRAFVTRGAVGQGSNAEFSKQHTEAVQVETLDAVVKRRGLTSVDFIKVDVEGAEPQVMAGATEVLNRFSPAVMLEIEQRHLERFGSSAEQVVEMMADYGYHMRVWTGTAWIRAVEVLDQHRNYLFTRRSPA